MNKKIEKKISKSKIKKGDQVIVLTGKDKGRKGKVLKIFKEKGKAIVEGINLKKKRVKPKTSGKKGETVEIPLSINISNVKIICSKCGKPTRIGKKIEGEKKQRICKKCKQDI